MAEGRTTGTEHDERDTPGAHVVLSIEPLSGSYDESDERWLHQVVDLVDQLREEVGVVQRRHEAAPGKKGAVDTMVIALGSARAFQAAVQVFRAWLARDVSRRMRLVVTDAQGHRRTVELEGDSIDNPTLRAMAEMVAQRLPMT